MSVDLPGLLVGLGLFALFGLWILSDWRVRSARSVALLLAGLAVVAFFSLAFDSIALWLLGLLIGVAFMTPVFLIHPLVMPLAGPDAEMSEHIAVAQRELVRAGQRFKRKQRSQSDYVADLEAIRRRLRRVEAADRDWADLLRRIDEELSGTIARASGRGGHEGREERRAIQREYRALISPRLRFWR